MLLKHKTYIYIKRQNLLELHAVLHAFACFHSSSLSYQRNEPNGCPFIVSFKSGITYWQVEDANSVVNGKTSSSYPYLLHNVKHNKAKHQSNIYIPSS